MHLFLFISMPEPFHLGMWQNSFLMQKHKNMGKYFLMFFFACNNSFNMYTKLG